MAKNNRPAYYAAPLKSRKDIVEFLTSRSGINRNRGYSPLMWNVKAYGVDLEFDNLVRRYKESGEYGSNEHWIDYPEYKVPCLARYEEVKDELFTCSVEDARRSVTDDDTNRCLWRGVVLNVQYAFEGRSGGWLIIREWEGVDITRMDEDDFHIYLEEMGYRELRNLYELVIQNDHDFRRSCLNQMIEEYAAFNFFDNDCDNIVRPTMTQLELPLSA